MFLSFHEPNDDKHCAKFKCQCWCWGSSSSAAVEPFLSPDTLLTHSYWGLSGTFFFFYSWGRLWLSACTFFDFAWQCSVMKSGYLQDGHCHAKYRNWFNRWVKALAFARYCYPIFEEMPTTLPNRAPSCMELTVDFPSCLVAFTVRWPVTAVVFHLTRLRWGLTWPYFDRWGLTWPDLGEVSPDQTLTGEVSPHQTDRWGLTWPASDR